MSQENKKFLFLELIKSVISRVCPFLSISIHQAVIVQASVTSGLNCCDCLLARLHAHSAVFLSSLY